MLVSIMLAAALSASWAPAAKFSLVCSGTQTGYQELAPTTAGPTKLTLPWSETFTVDLTKGTYCSGTCAKAQPIAAIGSATLDLANSAADGSSSLKRFQVAGGAYQSADVTGETSNDRFHLEKTGTCTIKP